ncbi:MAG: cytochrome c oxidase subunit II [Acidimicrobiia bacterium]
MSKVPASPTDDSAAGRPGRRRSRPLFLLLPLVLLAACSGPASMLDTFGPGARRVKGLWWLLFWISAVVVVVVAVLMAYSLRRRTKSEGDHDDPADVPAWGNRFVVWSGFIIPAVILVVVFAISLVDLAALGRTDDSATQVGVVGHMWWWEARYDGGAVTANEIHIPVGKQVEFSLTTDDVIHSLWIPSLHPKRDMIPGRVNTMTLQADEAGRYRGMCAEFCGLQHANMGLYVVADSNFDQWLAHEQEPAATGGRGEEVFLNSTCVGCHTIRGTSADAKVGPDLTHLASRQTIFAAKLDNTRENLATVITDPQSVKPGVAMPPTSLSAEDLDALLDYLGSLK